MSQLKGKPKKVYTDDEKQQFVELAAKVGVPDSLDILGYPDPSSAYAWCKSFGVEIPMSPLRQRAVHVREIYTTHEKLVVCQQTLDRAWEMLTNGEPARETYDDLGDPIIEYKPLSAVALSRVAQVVKNTILTMELLEGRVTSRAEQITNDSSELELIQMINEYKAKNDVKRSEIKARSETDGQSDRSEKTDA